MNEKRGLFAALNRTKVFRNLSEKEFSWVLYDVGNSAFTMLACSLLPIWFKSLAIGSNPGQISSDKATAYYSLAVAIVTAVVAIIGPFVGAISDYKDMKKICFTTTVAAGTIGCVLNGFAPNWVLFILIFVITKILYSTSQVVYDSMLSDVTENERMDMVSSHGFAWGYIGSCIPFIVALIFYILGPDMLGMIGLRATMIVGFGVTAVWWFVVTVPLIRNYKQIHYVERGSHVAGRLFSQIVGTCKHIVTKDKKVALFLLAFFLYIDGVGTIIDNCINIGTDLNLDAVGQVVTLLLTQVVAFMGSLVFSRLSKKYETVKLILVCIVGYFFVCLYALTLKSLVGFAILAFGVGCFQGSIQSLSRSYFAKIIPPEHSGEYFGIYDIFSKGSSFLGSAVIATVKLYGGTINVAVAFMAVFFALGFVFLKVADKTASAID
ncbi:MAG: MFS transporter [Lachnospiraceae bacterium]|nr:MFS transporter [Lachnospiraceae bacterium]